MTRYARRVLSVDDDGEFAVEGRVVTVLDSPRAGRNQITALVELPETDAPEAVADEDEEPTCAGKGGECSRTVESPGDRCWQHPEDDE